MISEEELLSMQREIQQLRGVAAAASMLIASGGGCFDMAIALVKLNAALNSYTQDKD